MSRRYVPEPDAVITVLAGRVDAIERRLDSTEARLAEIATDIAALGRGVADLTAHVRRLADTPTPRPAQPAGRPVEGGEDEEPLPQPDWFAVEDPGEAALWLEELAAFNQHVLARHDAAPPATCWPLHPDVVAELLALRADRDAAYDGDRPTPVSEWLARWLPTARQRIHDSLAACAADRAHHDLTGDGRLYDASVLDLASVGAWWATDRDTPASTAFALTAL